MSNGTEYDCDDRNCLICPYCGSVQYGHEDDEISAICCNATCECCEKVFDYSVDVTIKYSSDIREEGEAKA